MKYALLFGLGLALAVAALGATVDLAVVALVAVAFVVLVGPKLFSRAAQFDRHEANWQKYKTAEEWRRADLAGLLDEPAEVKAPLRKARKVTE